MKRVLALLATLLLAGPSSLRAADEPAVLPNVIFILADDAGFADFGCYGHPYARTPNVDSLAKDGTRFTQCYATGVTCCPARTGLMTSWLPARYPTYPADGGFGERVTVTELLRKSGYATGHFGKWHIGPDAANGTHGIDVVGSGGEGGGRKKAEDGRGRDAPIYDEAIRFIEGHRAQPFYVNVWSHIAHHRISPPARWVARFEDVVVDEAKFSAPMQEKFAACRARGGDVSEHMRRYLADLASMDDDIGRLLTRVDELGLRDRTIVVFSSDQGPADIRGSEDADPGRERRKEKGDASADSRLDAMGYAGGLRGGKHGMYEGGVRVPWIVRWPGRVPAGRVDDTSVISGADWLPTLCAIAGVTIDPAAFDGEDAGDAWLGKPHVRTKPLLWKTSSAGSAAGIREGPFKLIYPVRKHGGEVELFDVVKDPGEAHDLAAALPDVVKALSAKVGAFVSTLPTSYVKADDGDR